MSTKIDMALIDLCISKDRRAQKELYTLLLPYLNAKCQRYLYNTSDIEDVLQEAFINIFRSINQYDAAKAKFKTWAGHIAINCCLKNNDKGKRAPIEELIIPMHEQKEVPSVLKKLSNEEILAWLKQLPEQYYQVFNLFIIEGFSHREIAKKLNIEESLSRKRLSRSKGWLKNNNCSMVFSEFFLNS